MLDYLSNMNLLPNWTFFVQLLLFLILFFVLRKLIFNPFLKLNAVRQNEIIGKKMECERVSAEIKRIENQRKSMIDEQRRFGFEQIAKGKAQGEEEAANIVKKAAHLYHSNLEREKKVLNQGVEKTFESLAGKIREMGEGILKRVLE